eukprot:6457341-Amphidinium_carterae.2
MELFAPGEQERFKPFEVKSWLTFFICLSKEFADLSHALLFIEVLLKFLLLCIRLSSIVPCSQRMHPSSRFGGIACLSAYTCAHGNTKNKYCPVAKKRAQEVLDHGPTHRALY